jgi:predicted  nucleic acid-binding Zn-ribbon protein
MSIKIPSGPPESKALDAVKDAAEAMEGTGEATEAKEAGPVAQDAISRIAEQVASGKITRTEAVERLIAEVVDSDMIKSAPEDLSKEIGEALNSLLETDPYLKSLSAALGPLDRD